MCANVLNNLTVSVRRIPTPCNAVIFKTSRDGHIVIVKVYTTTSAYSTCVVSVEWFSPSCRAITSAFYSTTRLAARTERCPDRVVAKWHQTMCDRLVCICNYFSVKWLTVWPCVSTALLCGQGRCCCNNVVNNCSCRCCSVCVSCDFSFKESDWSMHDLRVACTFLFSSTLLCMVYFWIDRFGWVLFCNPLTCLLPAQVLFYFLCPPWYYLDFFFFCSQAFLAEPDKWYGVWVGGSWDTYVVVLFWYYLRSPHFSWALAARLSSFCVIWFRGCICSCPPSGTVRGRGSLACQITGCAERHSSVRKG